MGAGKKFHPEPIQDPGISGVLEIRQAEGTFVCEGFSESMIDPMIYGIILDKEDSYENLMELRELIKVGGGGVRHAEDSGGRFTYTEREAELHGERDRKRAGDVENAFLADNEFHNTISDMGKDPLVNKINQVVRVLTYSMRMKTVETMIKTGRGRELLRRTRKSMR